MALACLLTLGVTLRADVMLEDRGERLLGVARTAKDAFDADWHLQREILEHAIMTAPGGTWQLEPGDPRSIDGLRAAPLVPQEIIWRDVLDNAQARPSFPVREDTGLPRGFLAAAGIAALLVILLIVLVRRRLSPANVEADW